jgi:hypothetical protein
MKSWQFPQYTFPSRDSTATVCQLKLVEYVVCCNPQKQ